MKETALKQVAFRYQALYIETNQHENDTQSCTYQRGTCIYKAFERLWL